MAEAVVAADHPRDGDRPTRRRKQTERADRARSRHFERYAENPHEQYLPQIAGLLARRAFSAGGRPDPARRPDGTAMKTVQMSATARLPDFTDPVRSPALLCSLGRTAAARISHRPKSCT